MNGEIPMARPVTRYRTGRTELMGIRFRPSVKKDLVKLAKKRQEPMRGDAVGLEGLCGKGCWN
jgi:hypothetical protein